MRAGDDHHINIVFSVQLPLWNDDLAAAAAVS